MRVLILDILGGMINDKDLRPFRRKGAIVHITRSIRGAKTIMAKESIDLILLDCRTLDDETERLEFIRSHKESYQIFAVSPVDRARRKYVEAGCDMAIVSCQITDCLSAA